MKCNKCAFAKQCDFARDLTRAVQNVLAFVASDKQEQVKAVLTSSINIDCAGFTPINK